MNTITKLEELVNRLRDWITRDSESWQETADVDLETYAEEVNV